MEDLTGKQLGPYQVVAPLGEGGMAAVYRAYQPGMDRYVALKILPRHLAGDPTFVGRFEQEAKVIAKLQHPHILPVFDFGQADGYTYIVMPLLEGGALSGLLQGRPLPLERIRNIISQVGDALDYAHSCGLVHRDVKPSNVLIDPRGNCLLTDFGIAKMVEGTAKFTATGGLIGTPAYMSPEQGAGEKVDPRSDIYSLGVMLYEMATGRVPFQAETPVAIVIKHIHDPLPPPRTIVPSLPEALERVILKSLAKRPEDRFATAADMVRAIRGATADSRRAAAPESVGATPAPAAKPVAAPAAVPRSRAKLPDSRESAPSAKATTDRVTDRIRRVPMWAIGFAGLALVVILVILLAQTGGRSPAATGGAASVPTRGDTPEATLADDSSSDLTRLTNNPARDFSPAWSPDGGRLAFVSTRDGNEEILISDSDGLTRLTNNPARDFSPAWSPDGRQLAFVSTRDGNAEIYISDSNGQTRLTNNPADDFSPAWSPDGGELAFVSTRDGNAEIYINDSKGQTRLTNNAADDSSPAWSPDGGRLAFVSTRDGNEEIYINDADGLTRLTDNPARDFSPAWSPDGQLLAFVSDRDGHEDLYVMTPNDLLRLTDHPARDFSPAFSPDGRWLAFVSTREGDEEIYMLDIANALRRDGR